MCLVTWTSGRRVALASFTGPKMSSTSLTMKFTTSLKSAIAGGWVSANSRSARNSLLLATCSRVGSPAGGS